MRRRRECAVPCRTIPKSSCSRSLRNVVTVRGADVQSASFSPCDLRSRATSSAPGRRFGTCVGGERVLARHTLSLRYAAQRAPSSAALSRPASPWSAMTMEVQAAVRRPSRRRLRRQSHTPACKAATRQHLAAWHTAVRRDDCLYRLGGQCLRVEKRPVLVKSGEGHGALAQMARGRCVARAEADAAYKTPLIGIRLGWSRRVVARLLSGAVPFDGAHGRHVPLHGMARASAAASRAGMAENSWHTTPLGGYAPRNFTSAQKATATRGSSAFPVCPSVLPVLIAA